MAQGFANDGERPRDSFVIHRSISIVPYGYHCPFHSQVSHRHGRTKYLASGRDTYQWNNVSHQKTQHRNAGVGIGSNSMLAPVLLCIFEVQGAGNDGNKTRGSLRRVAFRALSLDSCGARLTQGGCERKFPMGRPFALAIAVWFRHCMRGA